MVPILVLPEFGLLTHAGLLAKCCGSPFALPSLMSLSASDEAQSASTALHSIVRPHLRAPKRRQTAFSRLEQKLQGLSQIVQQQHSELHAFAQPAGKKQQASIPEALNRRTLSHCILAATRSSFRHLRL